MKLRDMPNNARFKGIRVQTTENVRGYWGEQTKGLLALHQTPDLSDNPRMVPINDDTLEWEVLSSNYKLFLDQALVPKTVHSFMKKVLGGEPAKIYSLKSGWVVVQSMEQFITVIEANGLPSFVSFSHDLTGEHVMNLEPHYDAFKDTGYDCAVWLHEYCQREKLEFPKWAVHENTHARQRIIHYINKVNNTEPFRIFYGQKKENP